MSTINLPIEKPARPKRWIGFMLLSIMIVAALATWLAWPTVTDKPADDANQLEAVPYAVTTLAEFLSVDEEAITLERVEDAEWPNACLGLPTQDEICAEVLVPGYKVVMVVEDQIFNVRTDERGQIVRIENAISSTVDDFPFNNFNVRQELATKLGVSPEAVAVISFERGEWSDSCLGLGGPAESCAAVVTPGWRVMLNHAGVEYEVRTDVTGTVVRAADPEMMQPAGIPLPEMGGAIAFYQRSGGLEGEVVTVHIFADGLVERSIGRGIESEVVETFSVDPGLVEALLADLEAVGYSSLERSYLPENTCCDRFMYLTGVEINGQVHATETIAMTEETPAAVWESIQLIERVVDQATTQ